MKPIIHDGRELNAGDILSIRQHVEALRAAAEFAGDQYNTGLMDAILAILTVVTSELVS